VGIDSSPGACDLGFVGSGGAVRFPLMGGNGQNAATYGTAGGAQLAHARRHQVLGVIAGALNRVWFSLQSPELIIVGLIAYLTDSYFLVALVVFINKLASLAPQLFVSSFVEHLPRRRPQFIAVTVMQGFSQAALLVGIWLLVRHVGALSLAMFFVAYTMVCVCFGAAQVLWVDMVGRLIPHERMGTFFGVRQFVGGVAAVLVGAFVIQPILTAVGLPLGYLYVAALGSIVVIVAMAVWSFCREQEGPKAERPTNFRQSFRRGWGWLRSDGDYRCFVTQRVAFRFVYLGLAFFIPYGRERLHSAPGEMGVEIIGGVMVATLTISMLIGSALWGWLSDRSGVRAVWIGSGVLLLGSAVLAWAAPRLPGVFSFHLPAVPYAFDLRVCTYLAALAFLGCGIEGNILGGNRYAVTAAPPHRRAGFFAFPNTITSPLTLLPFAAAKLAVVNMTALLGLVAFGGALAVGGGLRMSRRAGPSGRLR